MPTGDQQEFPLGSSVAAYGQFFVAANRPRPRPLGILRLERTPLEDLTRLGWGHPCWHGCAAGRAHGILEEHQNYRAACSGTLGAAHGPGVEASPRQFAEIAALDVSDHQSCLSRHCLSSATFVQEITRYVCYPAFEHQRTLCTS